MAKFRQLLDTTDLPEDDREAVEADLGVIEDESAAAQQRPERLRPLLRRLQGVLVTGALTGAEAGAKDEVIHLIDAAQRAIGG